MSRGYRETSAGPASRARRKVLNEYIRACDQLGKNILCRGVFDVEREAFLRAIEPDKPTGVTAHRLVVIAREVARSGAFDLDDPRAEVGQMARSKGRRDGLFDRDDLYVFQRQHP